MFVVFIQTDSDSCGIPGLRIRCCHCIDLCILHWSMTAASTLILCGEGNHLASWFYLLSNMLCCNVTGCERNTDIGRSEGKFNGIERFLEVVVGLLWSDTSMCP